MPQHREGAIVNKLTPVAAHTARWPWTRSRRSSRKRMNDCSMHFSTSCSWRGGGITRWHAGSVPLSALYNRWDSWNSHDKSQWIRWAEGMPQPIEAIIDSQSVEKVQQWYTKQWRKLWCEQEGKGCKRFITVDTLRGEILRVLFGNNMNRKQLGISNKLWRDGQSIPGTYHLDR